VRRYWKGMMMFLLNSDIGSLEARILYEHQGKRPYASINFVTATMALRSMTRQLQRENT